MKTFLIALGALTIAGAAQATTITFDSTPQGPVADGFTPTGEPGISFFGVVPGNLQVLALGESNGSPALVAFTDTNGNYIGGNLSSPTTTLSLDFGNDDPNFTNPGDLAVLVAYNGTTLVGFSTVVLNRDDLLNQTISFTGGAFDSFYFAYTDQFFNPFTGGGAVNVGLIEVIDNVTFNSVPEASTLAVLGAGMGLLGFAGARRSGRA